MYQLRSTRLPDGHPQTFVVTQQHQTQKEAKCSRIWRLRKQLQPGLGWSSRAPDTTQQHNHNNNSNPDRVSPPTDRPTPEMWCKQSSTPSVVHTTHTQDTHNTHTGHTQHTHRTHTTHTQDTHNTHTGHTQHTHRTQTHTHNTHTGHTQHTHRTHTTHTHLDNYTCLNRPQATRTANQMAERMPRDTIVISSQQNSEITVNNARQTGNRLSDKPKRRCTQFPYTVMIGLTMNWANEKCTQGWKKETASLGRRTIMRTMPEVEIMFQKTNNTTLSMPDSSHSSHMESAVGGNVLSDIPQTWNHTTKYYSQKRMNDSE